MKALILAAGLGSRLKPWTDSHPKALVPVGGKPMLERLIEKMHYFGIYDITINVFHFADQITDFIRDKGWDIKISDERPELLETGGAILKASPLLKGEEPVIVHNADILSNADFMTLAQQHTSRDATLLVSGRESSRKLYFDDEMKLTGWTDVRNGECKPEYNSDTMRRQFAFSGIYVISPKIFKLMKQQGWSGRFSIIEFFLSSMNDGRYFGYEYPGLEILDIGKPDSLNRAEEFIKRLPPYQRD